MFAVIIVDMVTTFMDQEEKAGREATERGPSRIRPQVVSEPMVGILELLCLHKGLPYGYRGVEACTSMVIKCD